MSEQLRKPVLFVCALVLAVWLLAVGQLSGQRVCCEGDWWLKWGPKARETFVFGYTLGYSKGHQDGCQQGTKDWPAPIKPGIENDPERHCLNQEIDFSRGSDYFVKAVTEFYKRYPEDRDIYPNEVLEQLGRGLTIEQIHAYPFWRHQAPKENAGGPGAR